MILGLTDAFGAGAVACATVTDAALIEIFDRYDGTPAEQRSYIRTEAGQPIHFTLKNPRAEQVTFTALDNCLFNSADDARCDFMIGNLQKLFFVEIKVANPRQRYGHRLQAMRQLDSTLTTMKASIDLQHTELTAVICLGAKKVYPVRTAESASKAVMFSAKHNAALAEGNSAVF